MVAWAASPRAPGISKSMLTQRKQSMRHDELLASLAEAEAETEAEAARLCARQAARRHLPPPACT